jgi:putative selenium metabolism hydrolase
LDESKVRTAVKDRQEALIDFTQRIVRLPSLPGQEGEVAAAVETEMKALDYDKVWTDEAGNVIGKIEGGDGPTVLLNGHIDHVDPGPAEGWPYPPFSAQVVNGELWGRASADMKGPVACMTYATSLLKQMDMVPPGDVYMTVTVMEEIGGLGAQHLTSHLKADVAICGEPSRNILRRGHRGRIEMQAIFEGRAAHASMPHLGVNPHFAAAAFLAKLPELIMGQDEALGSSTVAPTLYATDQISPNVVPGEVRLTLDWRNVPHETPEVIVAKLTELIGDYQAQIKIVAQEYTAYTGFSKVFPSVFPAFILQQDDPLLQAAHAALIETLGRDEGIEVWNFATDGGHLMAAGMPTVGFGPGDERLAHTNQERISLAQMEEAVVAYVALIFALAEAADHQT